MKIIDLNKEDVAKACEQLISLFDCSFDLVVGIAEGGRLPAEIIAQKLNLPLLLVIRQRQLTQHKSRIKILFKHFPKKILNIIRIVENKLYKLLFTINKSKRKTGKIKVISENISVFNNPQINRILLVDDAIDSGMTINDVTQFLQEQNKKWKIKIAVLTQTFNHPLKRADYQIYNKVLLRFPWSNDFKK